MYPDGGSRAGRGRDVDTEATKKTTGEEETVERVTVSLDSSTE